MPRFAIYDPVDGPQDGPVVQVTSKSLAAMEADGRPFVPVERDAPGDLDTTHRVAAGALVPIGDAS